MRNDIGRILGRLISLLQPVRARHRAVDAPTLALPRVRDPYVWPMMRGEDARLVRPYLLAHERSLERHECRCQAGLRCAVHTLEVSM
ncbi:hypothetical protein AB0P45_31620 [Streptomyces niveus]|uniref:hypothetical protein n=1 Tax=Streptomyces niveus TaxID=193462 RepID=UPI00342D7852